MQQADAEAGAPVSSGVAPATAHDLLGGGWLPWCCWVACLAVLAEHRPLVALDQGGVLQCCAPQDKRLTPA
jgi:hypothetical protein